MGRRVNAAHDTRHRRRRRRRQRIYTLGDRAGGQTVRTTTTVTPPRGERKSGGGGAGSPRMPGRVYICLYIYNIICILYIRTHLSYMYIINI